jgi:ABC-type sulfate transport system substrate-binding protein
MDVQATAEAAPLPPISFPPLPAAAPVAPSGVAPADGASTNGKSSVDVGTPAPHTSGTAPVAVASLPPHSSDSGDTIGGTVAKLFNTAAENVTVSFQVAAGSNEVVVVFTDKTSGKTIVQFPSETLIALSQFFSKLAGTVLDKKA